jgi:hypothetical protein
MTSENPHRIVADAAGAVKQSGQTHSTASPPPLQPNHMATVAQALSIDETACQFLHLILPDHGPYIVFVNEPNGRKRNVFASTIEELWSIIKREDAAGHAAYHACASFKEAKHDPPGAPRAQRRFGRRKHNARGARSLWGDLDVGEGKPYPDWLSAAKAAAAFCRATGLPIPLCVVSGYGLHIYWPLQKMLERETWERYARGLKALCVKHGLHIDPARTADISSVLRTPGTHNRKGAQVRDVICGPFHGPYPIEAFSLLLEYGEQCSTKEPSRAGLFESLGKLPEYLASIPGRNLAEIVTRNLAPNFPPSFGAIIAEHCEQVGALRDSKGNLVEPLWYAALGVLAFCADGDRLGHEWSSGYPGYTEPQTQDRLDRARAFGPTTCAKFHSLNPTVCERCPFWRKINSPIKLGRVDTADKVTDQSDPAPLQQPNSDLRDPEFPFPLRWHGEKDNPTIKPEWLVKQLLPKTGAGLISGQWGTCKTFVAIDLAMSAMTGTKFAGRSVKRTGGVLFLAAEGASEIPIRLFGLVKAKCPGRNGKLPFAWVEGSPTLTTNRAIEQLARIAKEAADRMWSEFSVELALIIIDTMAAAAGFTDENSSAEGQAAMNVLNNISKRTGALVLACDHFGKAVETGTRGTSAKEAAADVVIACLGERTQAGNVTNLRIAVRKLRGGATGVETAFTLRTIDMGVDEDQEAITTCAIDWCPVNVAPPPEASKGQGWPKSTTLFRAALLTVIETHGREQKPFPDRPAVRAVELEKVHEEFDRRYPLDGMDRRKALNKRRQVFKRSREEAQARGLIGGREIEGKFLVWLVEPVQAPPTGQPSVTPA